MKWNACIFFLHDIKSVKFLYTPKFVSSPFKEVVFTKYARNHGVKSLKFPF
jgi:ABC-type uncharacterized transport system substrate-binding protein